MFCGYPTYFLTVCTVLGALFPCGYALFYVVSTENISTRHSIDFDNALHIGLTEEDRFDEFMIRQERPATSETYVLYGILESDLNRIAWSEEAAYESIRAERHAMVRAAEAAANARAAANTSARPAKIKANGPGLPDASGERILGAHGVAATSSPTCAAIYSPDRINSRINKPREVAQKTRRTIGIIALVQSQYHAIRNGYHGSDAARPRMFFSPANPFALAASSRALRSIPFSFLKVRSANLRALYSNPFRRLRFARRFALDFSGDPT